MRLEAALLQQAPELAEAQLPVLVRPPRPPSLGTVTIALGHLEGQLAAGLDGDGEARRSCEALEGLTEQRQVATQHLKYTRQ